MNKLSFCWVAAVVLSGCTVSTSDIQNASLVEQYDALSSSSLWIRHRSTSSAEDLAAIEAVLVSRGETTSGTSYIGSRSANAVGRTRYARADVSLEDTRNCSDFSSAVAAQTFFLEAGGPAKDPHNLD